MAYERDIKISASLQDSYKAYREGKGLLNKKQYLSICYDITQLLSDMIIRESLEYKLPFKLGFLRIRKKHPKLKIRDGRIDINKNIINWEATWEAWNEMYPNRTRNEIKLIKGKRVVFQTNNHTDGQVMRWYWNKAFCNIKNNTVYGFKPVKGGEFNGLYRGRLGLAKWIKHDDRKNDWYE